MNSLLLQDNTMETKKIFSLTMTQFPRQDWQINMCLDTETREVSVHEDEGCTMLPFQGSGETH